MLIALNAPLAAPGLRARLEHSGAATPVAGGQAGAAAALAGADRPAALREVAWAGPPPPDVGGLAYADLLAGGSGEPLPWGVDDGHATISINDTPGAREAARASCALTGTPT